MTVEELQKALSKQPSSARVLALDGAGGGHEVNSAIQRAVPTETGEELIVLLIEDTENPPESGVETAAQRAARPATKAEIADGNTAGTLDNPATEETP